MTMIAVRVAALIGWTLVRMLILPLAAVHYMVGILVSEVLSPMAAQMSKVRRDAEKESGVKGLVEAAVDG